MVNLTADRSQLLLLAVLAHLPLHRPALLVVLVLSSAFRPAARLQLAPFHRLAVAVLLLHRIGEVVGELLAVFNLTRLAHVLPHFAGGVVALFGRDAVALNAVLAVLRLPLTTLKIDGVDA